MSSRLWKTAFAFVAFNTAIMPLTFYWPTTRLGVPLVAELLGMLLVLLGSLTFFLGLAYFIVFLFRRSFNRAATAIALRLLWLASTAVGVQLGYRLRMQAFLQLAQRSQPLVSAISQFETDRGRPPVDLAELVPNVLRALPRTGMGGYPVYEYVTGAQAFRHEGNAWIIRIEALSPLKSFDQFLYFPRQNYPDCGYGGVLERVRDWAHVHE